MKNGSAQYNLICNHNGGIIDDVIIKAKPEGELVEFSFCGKCNRLIDCEQSMKWSEESLPF